MTRRHFPFLAFLVLWLLLITPFSFDFATSVVPGWHTTIFPPYFIFGFAVLIVLRFVTIGYWLLLKRVSRIDMILFVSHFILTIPTIIFLKFPSILLDVQQTNKNELIESLAFRIRLIPKVWMLFLVGQVLFLIYYVRKITVKPSVT